MTLSGARVTLSARGARLEHAAPLPVEAMILGRPVGEVAELLPRLFNLCPMAQGLAVRMALGLPATGPGTAAEITRDHLVKVCLTLPRAFGRAPLPLPARAQDLLGEPGLPLRLEALERWQGPLAGMTRHIRAIFPEGAAVTEALPPAPPLREGAYENSAAGRQADHPLLQAVEARFGRGPLWRWLGLLADLEAAMLGHLPAPRLRCGVAVVPAARGSYALRLTQAGGLVTGITRRTPTDHMLAPGGALVQALDSLPAALRGHAAQVVALHDPCVPVTVREVQDA